jgi:ElaB/YqjD/DUF883 family membrane-anchored ribosome-binding protein
MAAESTSNRHGKKNRQTERGNTPGKGHQAGARQTQEQAGGDSIRDKAEEVSSYVSERAGEMRDHVQESVRGREGTVVFVAMAVGLGIGVLVGTTLAAPRRRSPTWRDRFMAEGVGQRVLERLEDMLPEGFTGCLRR